MQTGWSNFAKLFLKTELPKHEANELTLIFVASAKTARISRDA
jgi:hypothetical protein